MASIIKRGDRWSCRFNDANHTQWAVALGTKSERTATRLMLKIEIILESKKNGQPLDAETAAWVESLIKPGNKLRKRLLKTGLIEDKSQVSVGPTTLADLIDEYVERRTDVRESTKTKWLQARGNLLDFFGSDKPIVDITAGDAGDFERYLKTGARRMHYARAEVGAKGLAPETVRSRLKDTKTIFNDAVKRKYLSENPFAGLSSSSRGNDANKEYIDLETIGKVVAAAPDDEWRLLIMLCRVAGLRCPTEILAIKVDDINWETETMLITCKKTEHHEGKETRQAPIFAAIRPYLDKVWHSAKTGQEYLFERHHHASGNLRTRFKKIIKLAGVDPWPGIFNSLRASAATDLDEAYPSHVVDKWLGNSERVRKRHYLKVKDEHHEKATGGMRTFCTREASQGVVNEESDAAKPALIRGVSHDVAVLMGDTGLEPVTPSLSS